MTLVLNCLTQKCLFQVSDRRFVRLPDGAVVEDNANKNVFYCGKVAFSYTGLAMIEGKRTDDWLLDSLPTSTSPAPLDAPLTVVKEKATEAFRKVNLPPEWKRHAFVGVGWIGKRQGGPKFPTVLMISNFHGVEGEELRLAKDEFAIHAVNLPENVPYTIMYVGQPIAAARMGELCRNVSTCIKRGTGPTTILRHLVATMRETARYNKAIGKNLLALGLPKEGAGKSEMVLRADGGIDDKQNSFLYIPADGLDGTVYHPSLSCGGASFVHNVLKIRFNQPRQPM